MPLFALLFASTMGAFASYLAQFMVRKVAIVAAAVSAYGIMIAALLFTFNVIVSPLVGQVFSTSYGQVLGLAFPPVAGTCMAAIGATWAACALYGWQLRALNIAVQA